MQVIAPICAVVALLVGPAIIPRLWRASVAWFRTRSVEEALGGSLFLSSTIRDSIRYYIEPGCEVVDPAAEKASSTAAVTKGKLFKTLDLTLFGRPEYRYAIILADSGMGKTSALINYYLRHARRLAKHYGVGLVFLGSPDAESQIKSIQQKGRKILLLDSLDEDVQAIADPTGRIRALLDAGAEFRRVVIACRTQLFANDGEIPKRTGILRVGSRRAGQSAEYTFRQIYLSPFTEEQVAQYLNRRFPPWRRAKRRSARDLVARIQDLAVRPMLLAHIEDLLGSKLPLKYPYQIYQEMVSAWVKREEGPLMTSAETLRDFSQRLAVEVFTGRYQRGSEGIAAGEVSSPPSRLSMIFSDDLSRQAERVTTGQISELANNWRVPLHAWQLTGRSLLTRDSEGHYRFAHRSIMECLFVESFLRGNQNCISTDWTDQMRKFLAQELQRRLEHGEVPIVPQGLWDAKEREADLRNLLGQVLLYAPMSFEGSPNPEWLLVMATLILTEPSTDVTIYLHSDSQKVRKSLNTAGPYGDLSGYEPGSDTEVLYTTHAKLLEFYHRSQTHPPPILVHSEAVNTLGSSSVDYTSLVEDMREMLRAGAVSGESFPASLCVVPLATTATFFATSDNPNAFNFSFQHHAASMVRLTLYTYFASLRPELAYPNDIGLIMPVFK